MRFLTRSLIGLFLLAATVGLLSFAGGTVYLAVSEQMSRTGKDEPQRERALTAVVQTVDAGRVTPILEAYGEVRSRRTLEVRMPLGGTVIRVADAFEEGGQVKAGDLLLEIDPTDAETALAKAQTDLAEADAELRDAKRSLALAFDELEAAENQFNLRAQALQRQRDLEGRGVGTEASVENAALSEAAAAQAVISRRQALSQAEARLDQAETRLSRREIEYEEAQRDLEDTKLFAEFDGTIADTTVVAGGIVTTNERVADLIDPDAKEIAFRISAAQYARLLDQDGRLQPVDVTVSLEVLGVALEATARLTRESGVVGEGQTGRLLFARLDGAPGFRPGDFVTVRLPEPPLDGVALVPSSAIGPDGTVLVVGFENRLNAVPVQIARRQGNAVIIGAREIAGAEIVAERTPILGAGIRIRPVRPGEQGSDRADEFVELDDVRRARLVSLVEGNARLPDDVKSRMIGQLEQGRVPVRMVERLEAQGAQ